MLAALACGSRHWPLPQRSLAQKDIDTVVAWVNAGAPQGNLADMPALPGMAEGWMIGKPDVVIEMPVDFEIPATGVLSYKSYNVPTNFTEDMIDACHEANYSLTNMLRGYRAAERRPVDVRKR